MVKTENQIWADIFTILNNILTVKKITGWTIRQGNQPTVENMQDSSIYITRLASRRYGWQAHRNKWNQTANKMIHSEEYFQEILLQVSAFKKRNPSDTNELTSGDVLNSFITFLQSIDGVKAMQEKGFQTYRIQELREPAAVMDNDLYEKLPSFDFSIVLLQNDDGEIGHTAQYDFNIKGI